MNTPKRSLRALPTLVATLRNLRSLDGPRFLHVVTRKGKGYAPAEADPAIERRSGTGRRKETLSR